MQCIMCREWYHQNCLRIEQDIVNEPLAKCTCSTYMFGRLIDIEHCVYIYNPCDFLIIKFLLLYIGNA